MRNETSSKLIFKNTNQLQKTTNIKDANLKLKDNYEN